MLTQVHRSRFMRVAGLATLTCLLGWSVSALFVRAQEQEEPADPPEVVVGERLFLETRFAQFFKSFLDSGRGVNDPLPNGDPVMETTVTTDFPLPGPFAGRSMNCRACHLVDEHAEMPAGGMRTYGDFGRRSPVPAREDGKVTAPRNSPPLVNASLPRPGGLLLHFDAEFGSLPDLVVGTLTGRNSGWLPGERALAVAHVARIINEDDGTGELAQQFGGMPYRTLLAGTDPSIPDDLRLPDEFRLAVDIASYEQIVAAVARIIAAYTVRLIFSQDESGAFNLSPYDVFLERNGLPRQPDPGELPLAYSRRLLGLIERLDRDGRLAWVERKSSHPRAQHRRRHRDLEFVRQTPNTDDGRFQFHDQPFRFGRTELEGLKIFFEEPPRLPASPRELTRGRIGNCIACHPAPAFTDFAFHNTGTAQAEYDRIHGRGAFERLPIPGLTERNRDPNAYLPATEQHPNAREIFRSVPVPGDPRLTDLGLWNIFANPDFPTPQGRLTRLLCERQAGTRFRPHGLCLPEKLLPRTIALFKTPGLRDLGHSAPYMHTGQFDSLEAVVGFYDGVSDLARTGDLRNADPEMQRIGLEDFDLVPLVSFLRALNEDYE